MSAPERAERFVLAWAARYTAQLPDAAAERRVQELQSDTWEQRRLGREVGAHPMAVATSMVVRTLAGVPADLTWRHQVRAVHRGRPLHEGGRPMGRWLKDNWWIALGALTSALTTALGVALPFEPDGNLGSVIGGIVIGLLGLTGLAGVAMRRRPHRRAAGDLMIVAGQLPWLPFFWTIVPPLLAVTVIVAAFIDLSDAEASGRDSTDPPSGSSAPRRVTIALLVALGIGAGALVGGGAGIVGVAVAAVVPIAVTLGFVVARVRRGRPARPA